MEENKNEPKVGDIVLGRNCLNKIVSGLFIRMDNHLVIAKDCPYAETVLWDWSIRKKPQPTTKLNDTQRAKNYLKETGLHLTPDAVREALWTGPGHITGATLGRKFRAASTGENPELCREHYVNDKGRTITRYFWNPEYKEIV